MRFLYRLLYLIIFWLGSPYWFSRAFFDPKYLTGFKTRLLGPGRLLPKDPGRPRVWLWALSLGEVTAAKKLGLAIEEAGAELIVTSTTLSGRAAAQSAWPGRLVLPSPFDFALSSRRFLDAVQPDLLVLVETDIWPGILFELNDRKIPKALVSTRISPRSLRNYARIKGFWGRVLRLFDFISVQSPQDYEKLIELGADPARTEVIGDLKFDCDSTDSGPEERARILAETGWPDGRWITAGSFHDGEDEMILDIFYRLASQYPDLKLLLAPRNKSEFETMRRRAEAAGFPPALRSRPEEADRDKKVFILDSVGELDRFYALAEIALVGKSWPGPHQGGGHNPLEPAIRQKPVLFGPQTHNFRWMTKALAASGGGLMCPDAAALEDALNDLLANPDKGIEMGRRARSFILTHQGSTAKTMERLRPLISSERAA